MGQEDNFGHTLVYNMAKIDSKDPWEDVLQTMAQDKDTDVFLQDAWAHGVWNRDILPRDILPRDILTRDILPRDVLPRDV